ncbi:MAG: fumarylacetoacetase [Acidobacteriota bacterium]|nr:fumarylacetoacetase [Acidobacteriota bacterium]
MALTQRSWIAAANQPQCDFPLQNLPYGACQLNGQTHLCVAIGDQALSLYGSANSGLFGDLPSEIVEACKSDTLNALMALGPSAWASLRSRLSILLDADRADAALQARVAAQLVPLAQLESVMPVSIGDYTDFYASIHHATRVGQLFRPDNPLLPNYKYVPIGYHGRASSVVLSGHAVRRPTGQIRADNAEPRFTASRSLDFELEVGAFISQGNPLGQPIPIAEAESHIFGLCLVNDWSARDIQAWEYQPLGPFLAKSFATSISPWIVPLAALAPYRVPVAARVDSDPAPLPYLQSVTPAADAFDVQLEVLLQSDRMREQQIEPVRISRSNLRDLYWSLRQLVTHHASNGCNLRAGDLLATGTISGPTPDSEGCLLEKKASSAPVFLPTGEQRIFLEDGDTIILRASASSPGLPRIGFGECRGTVSAALSPAAG